MCETRDTVVSNSDVAKRHAWQVQALSNVCCALLSSLIEQSNILLKQSVNIICYVNNI